MGPSFSPRSSPHGAFWILSLTLKSHVFLPSDDPFISSRHLTILLLCSHSTIACAGPTYRERRQTQLCTT
jgi:hypothetical protein